MYLAPFDYLRPSSWPEVVSLLGTLGEEAKVLAGGQSLLPMMSLRLIKPQYIIDVNSAGDREIREDGTLVEVSALARHADLERSPVIARHCPLVGEAASFIGNIRVRHRGTIGGSLAHADPAGELPCAAVALEAQIRTLSSGGERRIPATSFFDTYFTTALQPAEVITAIEFPAFSGQRGCAFVELTRRAGDFATLSAAAVVDVDPAGDTCAGVRLILGAIADKPVDVSESVQALLGERLDERLLEEVATHVAGATDPREDHRASAGYRREMVKVFTRRALSQAWDRALGNGR